MTFQEFEEKLKKRIKLPLPGREAQYKMAPLGRGQTDLEKLDENKVKKAAVMALFANRDEKPNLILTLRPQYQGVHSGQISFPGGKREEKDRNFMDTALRETYEEIGISPSNISVMGKITSLYIPPSNFLVHPYLGIINDKTYNFTRQKSEVEQILQVNFNQLLSRGAIREQEISTRGFKIKVPVFPVGDKIIWGATAMMISELREMFTTEL